MTGNHFAGTGKLLKLYLRRDRIVLPIWTLLPVFLIMGQMSFTKAMPDWQVFLAELSQSPVTSAILGPIVPLSLEGAILWRGMVQASIALMFGAALTLIRHTRTEEASGRNELLLGRPIGRYANLTAALLLCCGGSLLAGLLTVAVLLGSGFAETVRWWLECPCRLRVYLCRGRGLCAQILSIAPAQRCRVWRISINHGCHGYK